MTKKISKGLLVPKPESKTYCGPFAIAAVTGKPVAEVIAAINDYRNKPADAKVVAMATHEIEHALKRLDVSCRLCAVQLDRSKKGFKKYPTMRQFLKSRSTEMVEKKMILLVTGHFVAVQGFMFIDTWTKNTCLTWDAPHQNRRVRNYVVID